MREDLDASLLPQDPSLADPGGHPAPQAGGLPAAPATALDLLTQQAGAPLPAQDVVWLMLPLMKAVAQLHDQGRVARLDPGALRHVEGQGLQLIQALGLEPVCPPSTQALLRQVDPLKRGTLQVLGESRVVAEGMAGERTELLHLQMDLGQPLTRPVLLPGWTSWEQHLGLHDALTDIYQLGLLMAALACGLDFTQSDDLHDWARHMDRPQALVQDLHPVLASVIRELCALSRHDRAQELWQPIERLLHWQDAAELSGPTLAERLAAQASPARRKDVVLAHLRDRLFDLSRRNRLLHYRPGQGAVNLTAASVPMVLQVERIQADDLVLWQGPFAKAVLAGKPLPLNRWLRLDEQPDVPPSLDRLISDARRDRAEYGFSPLRLVVAFLRWHHLKEDPDTRIETPLLWLPATLSRQRGLRDQYQLQCESSEAEFNPVLRHQLRQLYGIQLPERVDLAVTPLQDIHADLQAQIRASDPGVTLRLLDRPAIRLVREKAQQRLQLYRRRHRLGLPPVGLPPYSYDPQDFRPLGQALFEQRVRPKPLPARLRAGDSATRPHQPMTWHLEAPAAEERVGYAMELPPGDRHLWDLDLTQLTLANFQYKKMSLVKDYQQLLDAPAMPAPFEQLFSPDARERLDGQAPELPEAAQHPVVPLDATQTAAVALARTGRSFIIQGPPGTGKSQTITNLIADFAAQGRRVLFVCEKRAALDVVFHRLKQSGLSALCTLIHDSQDDKKAFIADLKACYEAWLQQPCELPALEDERDALMHELAHHSAQMAAFDAAMNALPPETGHSWRALLRRQLGLAQTLGEDADALAQALHGLGASERAQLPGLASWDAHRPLVEQVGTALRHLGVAPVLAQHPAALLDTAFWQGLAGSASPAAQLAPWLDGALSALSQLEDLPGLAQLDPSAHAQGPRMDALTQLLALVSALDQAGLTAHGALLLQALPGTGPAGGAPSPLLAALSRWSAAQAQLSRCQEATAAWTQPLAPADTARALARAQALEGRWTRWLQPAWWQLRRLVQARHDFSRHALPPTLTEVLQALQDRHQAEAALAQLADELARQFQVPDAGQFLALAAPWVSRLQGQAEAVRLLAAWQAADAQTRDTLAAQAGPLSQALAPASQALRDWGQRRVAGAGEALRDLEECLPELDTLQASLQQLASQAPGLLDLLARHALPASALEAWLVHESLDRLARQHPGLEAFDGQHLARHAQAAQVLQARRRPLEARRILHQAQARFLHHVQRASTPAAQLDEAGKAWRKAYGTGRKELEHEFGKTMRHRAIRDLADDETGLVLRDLKPVWLMSPLSVSETLPLDPALFDVVIFDEASQIPTEEAVPALCRAPQVVVVGDEMQLPPSQFFSASGDEDDELSVEEDGELHRIQLDADSLLSQAARQLPATLLAWHYRSRHEALISFSNAAFYAGQLVTVPDRPLPAEPAEPGEPEDQAPAHGVMMARAATAELAADSAEQGLRHLLAQPLSVHRLTDAVYLQRRNTAEASYIAHLVREYLMQGPGMSLGIVAFSEAQQGCIEQALQALAETDPAFAQRLDAETLREDDDQFNGLFIKNLENVQGDERDVMLLSICYAPGPDGRMAMNFGPINQRGGEKRLNVIFSRARHRMAVVCSIEGEAITNVHNDGANALRTFLLYARACAQGQEERARGLLGQLGQGADEAFLVQPAHDPVRDALADALRARGLLVQAHVGQSRWRVDLAVRQPGRPGPSLAVLLDGEQAHAEASRHALALETHVFRPGLLRAFGWQALSVHARDWLRDPLQVLSRIEAVLRGDPDPALVTALPGFAAPPPWVAPVRQASPLLPAQSLAGAMPSPSQPSLPLEHSGDHRESPASSSPAGRTSAPASPAAHGPTSPAGPAQAQRSLRCQEGGANKFWRVARHGADLHLHYGRVGQAGQRLHKPFDTAERAQREFDKLVAEKLRKGYVEEEGQG